MSRALMYVGAVGVLLFSLLLVAAGPITGLIAVGLVVVLVALTCFGPEMVGMGFLAMAFATAPVYKGLAPEGSTVTPTDLCLTIGFTLLLPRLLRGSFRLPTAYVLAVAVIAATCLIGSFVAPIPALSIFALILWLATMFVLPTGVHLMQPGRRTVNTLAWMYVAGHIFSTTYGLATGRAVDGGRYYGLTNHPNYFAEAGVVATGLLLHLWATGNRKLPIMIAMPICVYSVYLSGSRAGFLTLAVLVAAIPVVERSAIKGYLIAFGAAVGGAFALTTLSAGATGGAVSRLSGQGSAAGSNEERIQGLREGWDRFLAHPLSGSGLVDLFNIHNNYLEVLVATGVFGFVAFVVVIVKLGAPLIGTNELRRLCYSVLAYAAFSATTPGLYDRTFWVPIALGILAVAPRPERRDQPVLDPHLRPRELSGASAVPSLRSGPLSLRTPPSAH